MEESIDMRCTMMPEEGDLALSYLLASVYHKLNYIVKMPEMLDVEIVTYLFDYGSFLGLISSCLNQAK